MTLFHSFDVLTGNGKGLVGYQVLVRGVGGGPIQPIYADANMTPIYSVSELTNTALTDNAGNWSFFVAAGSYDLEFRDPNGIYLKTISNATLFTGQTGDAGPTGPANSTYGSLALLKAADPTNASFILADGTNPPVTYAYVTGNFTGADDEVNVVALNGVPIATGALVRQTADTISYTRPATNAVPLPTAEVLDAYEVTPEQFGAVGDGVTDDAPAIQKALDAISARLANGKATAGYLLFVGSKRYWCLSTVTMDRAYHNLTGTATLDFSGAGNGVYLRVTGSYTEFSAGHAYGQSGSIDGQITIVGSRTFNPDGSPINVGGTGILFDTPLNGSATLIRLIGATFVNCGVACQFGSRGYNQEFFNCKWVANGVDLDWLPDPPAGQQPVLGQTAVDADERIAIYGGTSNNSALHIRHRRPAGCIYAFGMSIDYTSQLMQVQGGKVRWYGCHTEAANWIDGTINVSGDGSFVMDGGWFLMQQNNGNLTNYVNVGAGANVKLLNIITNNTNNINTPDALTPTTWATGAGRFEMQNCEPGFEFAGFPARLHVGANLLSDGEFERSISEDMRWITSDTQPITDRYTGTNIKLTRSTSGAYDGAACLRVDKMFGGFSSAAFILMCVPIRWGDKIVSGFRVRTAADRVGNNQQLAIKAGFGRLDGFGTNNIPFIARFSPFGELDISPSSTGYQLVRNFNGTSTTIAPAWATHYLVMVDAVIADQASWLFDGLWIDRM